MTGDGPSRNPLAPAGSADNPVQFWDGRDPAYEKAAAAAKSAQPAERSLSEARDDDLIQRAKAQAADGFMAIQRSQAISRRRHAEIARERAEPAAGPSARSSGSGWPEYAEISR